MLARLKAALARRLPVTIVAGQGREDLMPGDRLQFDGPSFRCEIAREEDGSVVLKAFQVSRQVRRSESRVR